jgi:hypothetical protein
MRPGRPPLYEPAASERIEVRVTPEQRTELQRAAEERGSTISAVVRELLDERIEDHRSFPGRRIGWDGDDEH